MTDLPNGWARATVDDVTLPIAVVDPKATPERTFAYVDIGSIDNRSNRIADPKSLLGRDAPSRARQLLRVGDTVVSTVRTYLRNIGFVDSSLSGAIGSTGFAVLRPAQGIHPRFLYYHSLTNTFVDGLSAQMRGTSYPAVVDSQVRAMAIPVPPTAEQTRIVAAIEEQFSRLDVGVTALTRTQTKLKQMRNAVLHAAVTGSLIPAANDGVPFELLDSDKPLTARLSSDNARKVNRALADLMHRTWQVPPSWRWLSAAEVCEVIASGSTPSSNEMSTDRGEVPYIKVCNLTNRGALDFTVRPTFISHMIHTGRLSRSRLRPGDILTNIVGPPLGKVAVVPDDYPEWNTNQAVVAFRPIRSLHPLLLKYWLLSPPILALVESTSRATAGQFNVSVTTCRALTFPIPPRVQQEIIVDSIEEHLARIDSQEQGVAAALVRAAHLRSAILAAAFSGELVPQYPGEEPASVLLERISGQRGSSNGCKPTGLRNARPIGTRELA